MVKVEIFSHNDAKQLQDAINYFIKDKDIVDIKYTSVMYPTSYSNGSPSAISICDRVLIMYVEDEND